MNNTLAFRPLAKAVSARRETQRHLDCPSQQIAPRAVRQASTMKVRSRARRQSGPRHYHRELVERLAVERWGELDGFTCRLAAQEQVIDELEHCDQPLAQ